MRSTFLTVVAALAILTVAACSGSGSATPLAGSASATPAAGASATPAGTTATTPAPTDSASAATSAPPSAAAIDTCKLLSAADLKGATGLDYGAGVADDYGQCTWRVGGAKVNNGDGQVIAAVQEATLDTIKGTFAGGKDLTASGRAAYWNPEQGLQSIWVDIGGRTLVLSFDPVPDGGQAVAQKVAELALAKL